MLNPTSINLFKFLSLATSLRALRSSSLGNWSNWCLIRDDYHISWLLRLLLFLKRLWTSDLLWFNLVAKLFMFSSMNHVLVMWRNFEEFQWSWNEPAEICIVDFRLILSETLWLCPNFPQSGLQFHESVKMVKSGTDIALTVLGMLGNVLIAHYRNIQDCIPILMLHLQLQLNELWPELSDSEWEKAPTLFSECDQQRCL